MSGRRKIEIIEDGEVYYSYVELKVLRQITKRETEIDAKRFVIRRIIATLQRCLVDDTEGNVMGSVLSDLCQESGLSRRAVIGVLREWKIL